MELGVEIHSCTQSRRYARVWCWCGRKTHRLANDLSSAIWEGPRQHPPLGPPQDRTSEHNLVTESWVKGSSITGCSQPKHSSFSAYTPDIPVSWIKSSKGGDCGSSGPGPKTPGDPMSDKPSNGLDICVCVTPDSSESDMTISENPK
ncbi:hypothetical protein Tco_0866742 [Tanacetum coccineum]